MKKLLVLLALLLFAGCDDRITIDFGLDGFNLDTISTNCPRISYPPYQLEMPTMNLLPKLRQSNWRGPSRQGSCVHASMVSLLRWQNKFDLAKHWRETYGDGEFYERFCGKLDSEGIPYASTNGQGDMAFCDWACQTRRGCMVTCMGGRHMICLVYLDGEKAGLLDNNDVNNIQYIPRAQFESEWRNSDSWALAPLYSPLAPLPY